MAQNNKVYLLKRVVLNSNQLWDHDELLEIFSNPQAAISALPSPNYSRFVTSYDVDGGPDSERLVYNMLPQVELHFEPARYTDPNDLELERLADHQRENFEKLGIRSEGEQFVDGQFAYFYREAKRLGARETSEELAKQITRLKKNITSISVRLRCFPHDPKATKETIYERAFIVGLTEILISRNTVVKDLRDGEFEQREAYLKRLSSDVEIEDSRTKVQRLNDRIAELEEEIDKLQSGEIEMP